MERSSDEIDAFSELVGSLRHIVWSANADGHIDFISKWGAAYAGLSDTSAAQGWEWLEFVHPEDRILATSVWTEALNIGQESKVDFRLRRHDGVYRWFESLAVPKKDETGRVVRWYGTCTDIQELKDALEEQRTLQEQVRQSQKMEALGRLAGGVAHDFNNLLMIINSYASMLTEEFAVDSPMYQKVAAIQEAGSRAVTLTAQLLAFSRKQVIRRQVVSVDELVQQRRDMLARLIREDITLTAQLESANAQIQIDPSQLEQVLMNLLVNASDAMPQGGQLTIRTESRNFADRGKLKLEPGAYVVISVSDTGVGMDEATQDRIFEPFFTTKGPGKGTGLGLATVYGIVEQSQGALAVRSRVGEGTTIEIYLPRVFGEARRKEIGIGPGVASQPNKPFRATVLLVEDEGSLRRCLANALTSLGCYVIQAQDGAEAYDLASRQLLLIDCVVTDMVMPRSGGRELIDKIRLMRPRMPVVFISGYSDVGPTDRELQGPETRFLQKPFSPSALLANVKEMLTGLRRTPPPAGRAIAAPYSPA
jgi:PAS domain S-box-containing protein